MAVNRCKFCGEKVCKKNYLNHIKEVHHREWEEVNRDIIDLNNHGHCVEDIADIYGFNSKELKKELLLLCESFPEYSIGKPKSIKKWEPDNFKLQATTVWSFPERGDWATHKGDYRGNWAPQIPRNIILRYSKEEEVVLDQFVGSGVTLVETKLLKRRGIGIDINPKVLEIAKERISFKRKNTIEPSLLKGDARDLKKLIADNSIDLICTHPPYANIIKYSEDIKGDLSLFDIDEYLEEMQKVADECLRVLKPNRYCAILIGDTRRKSHMIPLGFMVMQKFLDAGFILKETIIKEQHNCKATGFWYYKSIENNFLLIAHEYLFVFRKP